jgi:hypothetical protein
MPDLVIPKPQPVRKVKKGDCGTCHWFERAPAEPKPGVPWAGYCHYNPPIAGQTMVAQMGPQGMGAAPMFQGILPPVFEIARCHFWTAVRPYYDAKLVEGQDDGTAAA